MKYVKVLIITLLFGVFFSCNKKLDGLLDDPNGPTLAAGDVDAFLNQVQISFRAVYTTASDAGGALSRQQALTSGTLYANSFSPESFDGIWTSAYTGVVKHADALIPVAEEQKKYLQAGIAKILKAYTMATLVDYFGDVPYSEADLGFNNINPKADGGQAVYTTIITLIDSAISNFNTVQDSKTLPKTDLFYDGDKDKWKTFANTLKLKLYMQERLVLTDAAAKITELETENDLIYTNDQDFQFQYGKNLASPDTRHPHYTANYLGGGAGDYIGNQFLFTVTAKKTGGSVTNLDPRRRYYFYRQVSDFSDANSQTAPCVTQNRPAWYLDEMPFCLGDLSGRSPDNLGLSVGYWGRDHGDASGVGPDNYDRTAWGLYPAGGEFDASTFKALSSTDLGAGGKGIDPIWLSSFTYFLMAEAALTLKVTTNGDAEMLLEQGIRESINKVLGFPDQVGYAIDPSRIPDQAAIDNYVATVLDNYGSATNDDDRLNIIMEEYYIALWGNGIEPYNNLRRTGKPENLQ